MKVSALAPAQVFRELERNLPFHIALQLVTDEEVGGRNGTLHQIGQGYQALEGLLGELAASKGELRLGKNRKIGETSPTTRLVLH
jgi:hypothetical protein